MSALSRSGTAALFWVERDPDACRRSLIARRLAEQHHVTTEHLRPAEPLRTKATGPLSTAEFT